MNHFKCVLSVIAGAAFGVAVAELILGVGPRDAGLCIGIMSACVLGIGLVRALQKDEQIRQARADVWARRDADPDWIYCRPLYELPEFDEENQR